MTLLLVALYYLLASLPFAYYHFLQFPHFSWLPAFVRFHPVLMAAGLVGLLTSLRELTPACRRCLRYVWAVGAAAVAWMAASTWIPQFQTFEGAAVLCFVVVALTAAAAIIDIVACRDRLDAETSSHNRPSAIASAAIAGALAASVYVVHASLGGGSSLRPAEIAIGIVATLCGHCAVFAFAAFAMTTVRAIAARTGVSRLVESGALAACAAVLAAIVIRRVLLTAVDAGEFLSVSLAPVLGIALVANWMAVLLRRSARPEPVDLINRAFLPFPQSRRQRVAVFILCGLFLIIGVGVLPGLLVLADWAMTLQKGLVLASWGAAFALVLAVPHGRKRVWLAAAVGITVSLAATSGVAAAYRGDMKRVTDAPVDMAFAVERYSTIDASLTVILDLVRPALSDGQFLEALRAAGVMTADPSLKPVARRTVGRVDQIPAYRPHIFVVVVDSLRPDYLPAYNPDASFAPAIGEFARDSIVMKRAFTPYAGTALSQPALWAGGLIPRAMYPKPFSPLNNLERLITTSGYRRYISIDKILSLILEDQSNLTHLDEQLAHPQHENDAYKFEFCTTVTELTDRLRKDKDDARPIFFYSQPQNMHIRVVADYRFPRYEGQRIGSTEFFKPAVASLRRVDACFGRLIDFLKVNGLYDNSIVVLTSDHGDAYGEDGRWGHATYVAPEGLRIPLIVHVPERLRRERQWNADAVAMLTDVTPTLYELLGYEPQWETLSKSSAAIPGRPLFTRVTTAPPVPRSLYLVQSSYNDTFGLLDGKGEWLYAASPTYSKEQFFDLRQGRGELRALPGPERLKYRRLLLESVRRLGDYYAQGPHSPD